MSQIIRNWYKFNKAVHLHDIDQYSAFYLKNINPINQKSITQKKIHFEFIHTPLPQLNKKSIIPYFVPLVLPSRCMFGHWRSLNIFAATSELNNAGFPAAKPNMMNNTSANQEHWRLFFFFFLSSYHNKSDIKKGFWPQNMPGHRKYPNQAKKLHN